MFVNPRVGAQLVKDHQQELLASARQQHRIQAARAEAPRIVVPGGRLRTWVTSALARRRPAASA
jgi:hypothetical protein